MRTGRDRRRVRLVDGGETTIHLALFSVAEMRLRIERLSPAAPLEEWCARHGVDNAVSGWYSVKPELEPLGELWVDGRAASHRRFADPWHAHRAALAATNGRVAIDYRDRLPSGPSAGLLQAGPLLVRDGHSAIVGIDDPDRSTVPQKGDIREALSGKWQAAILKAEQSRPNLRVVSGA
jgi:hypothetical protein